MPLIVAFIFVQFFLAPHSARAESICDPGSGFGLSQELRAKWCPNDYPPTTYRVSRDKPAKKKRERKVASLVTPPEPESDRPIIEKKKKVNKVSAAEQPLPEAVEPEVTAKPKSKPKAVKEESPVNTGIDSSAVERVTSREGGVCSKKELKFSADNLPQVPGKGSNIVWGGNATEGQTGSSVLSTGYSAGFLSRTKQARQNGLEVFAYLEGPCGFTNGQDKGNEVGRCRGLHNNFNSKNAKGAGGSQMERWKPFTMFQLRQSGKYEIGHCEIDNLNNNVNIPLINLLKEIKKEFDKGEIYCRLVLKNVSSGDIDRIKKQLAPEIPDAGFISPFQIKEASGNGPKRGLQEALERLKGSGVATFMSIGDWASDNYGSAFSKERFLTCGK